MGVIGHVNQSTARALGAFVAGDASPITGEEAQSPVYRGAVATPQRVLIDFDYEAIGIWRVLSSTERRGPPPKRATTKYETDPALPPWSGRLSEDLLDALREWNDSGVRIVFLGNGTPDEEQAFWALEADLAVRVQEELGDEFIVLYAIEEDAWRWVLPPWERNERP